MATYHQSLGAPPSAAHTGLEVLTDFHQPYHPQRALESPSSWGSRSPPSTSCTSSWDKQSFTCFRESASDDDQHRVTHHPNTPIGHPSLNTDRAPVANLEEKARELQSFLVLLIKDLEDLEKGNGACHDNPFGHSVQSPTSTCSWCRAKSKLGSLKRQISARAKRALRISRKQEKASPSELSHSWDEPCFEPPVYPGPSQSDLYTSELPVQQGLVELHHEEKIVRWELEECLAPKSTSAASISGSSADPIQIALARLLAQEQEPSVHECFRRPRHAENPVALSSASTFPISTSPSGTPSAWYLPSKGFVAFKDFSAGAWSHPARPPPKEVSLASSSTSSSFRDTASWVTPQSTRSSTGNNISLIATTTASPISGDPFCESPTTFGPSSGDIDPKQMQHIVGQCGGLWASTSTLADEGASGVSNFLDDLQWTASAQAHQPHNPLASVHSFHTTVKGIEFEASFRPTQTFNPFQLALDSSPDLWGGHVLYLPPRPSSTFAFEASSLIDDDTVTQWDSKTHHPAVPDPQPRITRQSNHLVMASVHGHPSQHMVTAQHPKAEKQMDDSALLEPCELEGGSYGQLAGFNHIQPPVATSLCRDEQPIPAADVLHPLRHKNPQGDNDGQSSLACGPCNYSAIGPGQHKKMQRHKRSNKHRKRAGEEVVRRMLCPALSADGASICRRRFGRRDNLGQHLRKDHGGLGLAGFGPIRYELRGAEEAEMQDP